MLYFASRPDSVFTAILHDALEDLLRTLTEPETAPGEAEGIWNADYPSAAQCFPLALAVDTLGCLLAASEEPTTVCRLTDYHWLLLYACLETYCDVHNKYARGGGGSGVPGGVV